MKADTILCGQAQWQTRSLQHEGAIYAGKQEPVTHPTDCPPRNNKGADEGGYSTGPTTQRNPERKTGRNEEQEGKQVTLRQDV